MLNKPKMLKPPEKMTLMNGSNIKIALPITWFVVKTKLCYAYVTNLFCSLNTVDMTAIILN